MKNRTKRFLATVSVLTVGLSAPLALAQSSSSSPLDVSGTAQSGFVNCFDYYQFGSVQAEVSANVVSAVSGTPVAFQGVLTNYNENSTLKCNFCSVHSYGKTEKKEAVV